MSNVIDMVNDGLNGVGNLRIEEYTNNNGREYTRLMGGFGEGEPLITDLQIAELLGYKNGARSVRLQVERNKKHFTDNDIIDFKSSDSLGNTLVEALQSLGYAKQSITQSKNIYGFSKAGFILFLKFAEGDIATELYKNFIEDYFKIKAENKSLKEAVLEQIEFLEEKKASIIGRIVMEKDELKRIELFKDNEDMSTQIMKLQSKLDNEKITEALEEQSRLTDNKSGYLNQTDFGGCFNLKMGSVTVGKLLKVVGLAMSSSRTTKPYEKYCPKYAQTFINQDLGRVVYKWNYNECIVFIDKWLKDNGHYESFYRITDKQIMTKFVNALCTMYV